MSDQRVMYLKEENYLLKNKDKMHKKLICYLEYFSHNYHFLKFGDLFSANAVKPYLQSSFLTMLSLIPFEATQ